MTPRFDIERYRAVRPTGNATPVKRRSLPDRRRGERFLKGPISWPWLTLAMALPGKAVHVGLHLWFEAGMTGSADVAPSLSSMQRNAGVSRFAASRGLAVLEAAGLVAVERHAGRKPRVRLLDATDAVERAAVLRRRRAHLVLVQAEPIR